MSLGRHWNGAQELQVHDSQGNTIRALAYPHLIGPLEQGDHVALNSTALDRGLGTGGYALVAAVLTDRGAAERPPHTAGHLVKARYTPTQAMVLGVDEQESPHHDTMREATDLNGLPVVTADLHSALPAIITGIEHATPTPLNIVYIMTDGGALPAWFSRTIDALRSSGRISATITTGQAYGGDYEAATIHTGLLAAEHVLHADIALVIQGPGNLGTGTPWGFSGIHVGEVLNATHILGGQPIASLRVSGADARPRHQGISHHSLTAIGRATLAPATVICPETTSAAWLEEVIRNSDALPAPTILELISQQISDLSAQAPHHIYHHEPLEEELHQALTQSPIPLSTMGRRYSADPLAFLTAALSGVYAAQSAQARRTNNS